MDPDNMIHERLQAAGLIEQFGLRERGSGAGTLGGRQVIYDADPDIERVDTLIDTIRAVPGVSSVAQEVKFDDGVLCNIFRINTRATDSRPSYSPVYVAGVTIVVTLLCAILFLAGLVRVFKPELFNTTAWSSEW